MEYLSAFALASLSGHAPSTFHFKLAKESITAIIKATGKPVDEKQIDAATEGFERGGNNELLAFLYISRGSAGEVRSMLRVLYSWKVFANHTNQISALTVCCETIAKQLYGWIEQVKRSEFRGQRHLNVATKPKTSRSILANHTTAEVEKNRRR